VHLSNPENDPVTDLSETLLHSLQYPCQGISKEQEQWSIPDPIHYPNFLISEKSVLLSPCKKET